MKILVFDNYDSFTYNLVHLIKKCGSFNIEVHRNDEIPIHEIDRFDKILISPGPGLPNGSGILMKMLQTYKMQKSILGVCLGHQAIAESFGGKLVNLQTVFHGIASEVEVIGNNFLFKDLPSKFLAGRYHSWVVDTNSLPVCFEITAKTREGHIMGLSHKSLDIHSVQFHPESILTEYGKELMNNWLRD